MKSKILLIITSFIIENIALAKWIMLCKNFKDVFHLTAPQITEYIIRDTNNEQQVPLLIIRLFYNKITATVFWGLKPYLRFWDVSFFLSLLSLIGCLGILIGIGYFLTQKKKSVVILTLIILLVFTSLFEVFFHPIKFYLLRLILISIPFEIISLFGIWKALGKNKIVISIIIIGIILSILLLVVYPNDFQSYCIGI